jgi:hypothetical protein
LQALLGMGVPALDIADVVLVRYSDGVSYKVSVLDVLIVFCLSVFMYIP